MALYPDVQRQAQREIENVIGTGRLPGFSDMVSLSYIEAIVLETMRWHPVTPLGRSTYRITFNVFSFTITTPIHVGLPHLTLHNDVYNGYKIPAGEYCALSFLVFLD